MNSQIAQQFFKECCQIDVRQKFVLFGNIKSTKHKQQFCKAIKKPKNIMDLNMKPSLAVDEMFSEGAGYMDMEEASS